MRPSAEADQPGGPEPCLVRRDRRLAILNHHTLDGVVSPPALNEVHHLKPFRFDTRPGARGARAALNSAATSFVSQVRQFRQPPKGAAKRSRYRDTLT